MLGTAPDTRDAVVNKIAPNLMELIGQEWVWEGADAQVINDNCKRVYDGVLFQSQPSGKATLSKSHLH